jgi:hypothetical protein
VAAERRTDHHIFEIFRHQAGVVSRTQAKTLGMTERQIDYRIQNGNWIVVRRGVYRHRMFEVGQTMALWALTLGGNGYVSHRYAARLHRLEPELQASPEMTVRSGTHVRFPQVRIHESRQIDSANLCAIDGLPVSGVERTIMDVAAVEHRQWWIIALIDSAKRQGLTDTQRLHACLERHARRGRDGTVNFRNALLHTSLDNTPAIGHQSRRVAELLAADGLPYPFLEEPVFDRGEFIAQTDLSYRLPVVGFIDGYRYHKGRRQMNRDRWQRQRLRNLGLLVFEFTADQTASQPGYVRRSVLDTYRQAERKVRHDPGRYRWWTDRPLPGQSAA